jgi:NodT family efflux transporter outer membrane factor (OMF) lipoprotein
MLKNSIVMAMLALSLAACKAGPDYAPPPAPASKALSSGQFVRVGDMANAPAPSRWWLALGDPQLDALVAKGLANAPGLAAAEARLRQARSGLAATRTGLLPRGGTSLLYAHAGLPQGAIGGSDSGAGSDINLFNAGFDAQWEADIWGGKRRDVERARAEAGVAEARLADAQVALSAEIARSYIALRGGYARAALLSERHGMEAQLLGGARRRFAGGTVPRQLVEAGASRLARTEAEQADLAAQLAMLNDALAVLTGDAPGETIALTSARIPLPPAEMAIGDPAALLARRPDLRMAERQLAAATARIGIEKARRLPSLSFMGIIGIGGTSGGDLVDGSKLSTIALPRLSWNFLDFGRGKAAVTGAEAARDAALADYQGQVLAALQDAEGALARYGAARLVLARMATAAGHAREIARLQMLRGRAGTLSPAGALEAQRQAVDAQMAESMARADLTQAYVALAKALGLGWQDG